jgi:2-haloacid dehalogenase
MSLDFDHFRYLSFDCYGTLIDWETGLTTALKTVLDRRGIVMERNELLARYAETEAAMEAGGFRPYRRILQDVLVGLGDTLGFEPTEAELEAFPESIREWPAFPDSTMALQALETRYRLVILSNIDDDLFAHSRAILGIEFDRVFTAGQIGSYKPSPRNFEYLIEHLGVPLGEILHVAQSLYHDIAPAKELGLTTVWINRRHGLDGPGATPPAEAEPDLELPDLASLALLAGIGGDRAGS